MEEGWRERTKFDCRKPQCGKLSGVSRPAQFIALVGFLQPNSTLVESSEIQPCGYHCRRSITQEKGKVITAWGTMGQRMAFQLRASAHRTLCTSLWQM